MTDAAFERRPVAILSADVAGYSRLTNQDEEGTHRLLTRDLEAFTRSIDWYGGHLAHIAGDGILAYFETMDDALFCAVDIQRRLSKHHRTAAPGNQLNFRIGINFDDVIIDGNEIYGNGVNVAARLETLATPGGICISESARNAIQNGTPTLCEFAGEHKVKNIDMPVRAYRIKLDVNSADSNSDHTAGSNKKSCAVSLRYIAASIVILMAGLGLISSSPYKTFGPEIKLSEQALVDARITRLMREATDDFRTYRYTSKGINSSLQKYRQVVSLDPGNAKALQAIARITQYYVNQTQSAIAQGDIALAEENLSQVWRLDPDNLAAYSIRAQLAETRLAGLLDKIQVQQNQMHEVYARQHQLLTQKSQTDTELHNLLQEINIQQDMLQSARLELKTDQKHKQETEIKLEGLLAEINHQQDLSYSAVTQQADKQIQAEISLPANAAQAQKDTRAC